MGWYGYSIVLMVMGGVVFWGWKVFCREHTQFRRKEIWIFSLLILSVVLSGIALIMYGINHKRLQDVSGTDLVFLLDVSLSMNARDYHLNKNDLGRLEVAKEFIRKYVEKHPENRYGLSIFASDANDILPLTVDRGLFIRMLESVESSSFLQTGSHFLTTLKLLQNRFASDGPGGGVIILSDFEFQNESLSDPRYNQALIQVVNEFHTKHIQVVGIGVGNPNGSKIKVGEGILGEDLYKQDAYHHDVITRFDTVFFDAFLRKGSWKGIFLSEIGLIDTAVSFVEGVSFPSSIHKQVMDQSVSRMFYFVIGGLFFVFFFLFPHSLPLGRKK